MSALEPVASFQASTHCSLGSSGGPEQRTRLVPSDKCAASWGSEDAEMRMITARFIRVLLRYTDSLCTHYSFTFNRLQIFKRAHTARLALVEVQNKGRVWCRQTN